jgi:hypothetical protein
MLGSTANPPAAWLTSSFIALHCRAGECLGQSVPLPFHVTASLGLTCCRTQVLSGWLPERRPCPRIVPWRWSSFTPSVAISEGSSSIANRLRARRIVSDRLPDSHKLIEAGCTRTRRCGSLVGTTPRTSDGEFKPRWTDIRSAHCRGWRVSIQLEILQRPLIEDRPSQHIFY